jgi:uncharacterized protein YxjI
MPSMSAPGRGVVVACACGEIYELRAEYAGRLLQCPVCGRHLRAGHGPAGALVGAEALDPSFDRDLFLLNQRAISIKSKYEVFDRSGRPLLYVERPTYPVRTLLAYLGAAVAGWIFLASFARAVHGSGDVLGGLLTLTAFYAAVPVVLIVVFMSLRPLRHTTFYRDPSRGERLLEIRQDQRVALLNRTYTVRRSDGQPLARLHKNYLDNVLRKRWSVQAADGTPLCVAIEDSIILSLLRRVIGDLFGLLRTNFLIVRGPNGEVLGEFNRKFTLFDRYVLDLTADSDRSIDRRIALALGVMLDTGENR